MNRSTMPEYERQCLRLAKRADYWEALPSQYRHGLDPHAFNRECHRRMAGCDAKIAACAARFNGDHASFIVAQIFDVMAAVAGVPDQGLRQFIVALRRQLPPIQLNA